MHYEIWSQSTLLFSSYNLALLNSLCTTLDDALHINNLVAVAPSITIRSLVLNARKFLVCSPEVFLASCCTANPWRDQTALYSPCPWLRLVLAWRFDATS